MTTELDPYETLRLEMNKTFDMRDDYLQAPIAIFTFTSPNLEVAENARAAMSRYGVLGYVDGLDVSVGIGTHKAGSFDNDMVEVELVGNLAAGR